MYMCKYVCICVCAYAHVYVYTCAYTGLNVFNVTVMMLYC